MRKTVQLIVISILIIAVPMFSAFFVFSGVYQNMLQPQLSIALVNEDKGATFNGQEIYFGNAFVKDIERNNDYDWSVVSRGTADLGLASGDYDVAIIIPSDFSMRSVAIDDNAPEQAQLSYKVSPSANFLVEENAEKAVGNIQALLNSKLIDVYFSSVLHNLQAAQMNVNEMVTAESEHNTILHDEVAVNLTSLEKNFGAVEQTTTSLTGSAGSLESSSIALNQRTNQALSAQTAFSNELTQYFQLQNENMLSAEALLAKDNQLQKLMQSNTEISQLQTANENLITQLTNNKVEVEALQLQTTNIHDELQAIVDNSDGNGNENVLWQSIYDEIEANLPRDGSLSGIPTQIQNLCSDADVYDASSDADLVAVQRVCGTMSSQNPTTRVYTMNSVGTAPVLDPLTDWTMTIQLAPNSSTPSVKMNNRTISGTYNASTGIWTGTELAGAHGVTIGTNSLSVAYTLASTNGVPSPTVSAQIDDVTSGVQTMTLTTSAVIQPQPLPTAAQIKNAHMLDAYFIVTYGSDAQSLVANSGGDIAGYLSNLEASVDTSNGAREQLTMDLTTSAYNNMRSTIETLLTDKINPYIIELNAHHDAIIASIASSNDVQTRLNNFAITLSDWQQQETVINTDLTDLIAQLQKEGEVLVGIGKNEAALVATSLAIADQTKSQVTTTTAMHDTTERLAQNAQSIATESGVAVTTLNQTITTNDETLESNSNYNTNFATVFDNSKIGQRDNNDLYHFLSQPVVTNNISRNIDSAQTLIPYFTLLLLCISSFFTAYSFSTRKSKYDTNDLNAPSLPRQYLQTAMMLSIFSISVGLIIGGISAYICGLLGTDLIAWITLSGITSIAIALLSYAILKWLKSFGMLVLLLFFFIYLVMNSVLGFNIAEGSRVTFIQSLSPLWLLEQLFNQILFAINGPYFLALFILLIICGLSTVAIVGLGWRRKGVETHA
ncbi:type VII secretion protein EsaA [Listeria weihenstephanensis]|uniref:Type VII secretion system accessory factor EsaA n=1 Tax=Listeria weihenstephanensis TaxID=1006155 RepID=A0A841ZB95_9LIST|nr:type VII secretion protein EsaA [Listeria weihenstephanensis]MBC1502119.1 type VII secretion protein EsaA [Listeria weihenstephanensis]